jgi:hypothetical protein
VAININIQIGKKSAGTTTAKEPLRRKGSRKRLFVGLIVTLLLATTTYLLARPDSPIPGTVRQQAKFTLFYPEKVPAGYTVIKDSFAYQQGVLTYRIKASENTSLLVSEQRPPGDLSVENFHSQQLKEKEAVSTNNGTGYVGTLEHNRLGSFLADGTWVLVSGPFEFQPSQMSELLKAFEKS